MSAQSLRARVQRAPLTIPAVPSENRRPGSEAATAPATGSTASIDVPVRVHRGGSVGELATELQARSFTHGGEVYLPDSHGPMDTGTARSLLAHELTHVAQQRRLGSSLPLEHTPHGQALEAEAVGAERSPGLPLAMPPQPSTDRASAAPSPPEKPQRAAIGASETAVDSETTVNLPTSTQRAPMTAGSTAVSQPRPADRGTNDEQELEDLAQKLYARIGRRLRRELLVDRERAGLALEVP